MDNNKKWHIAMAGLLALMVEFNDDHGRMFDILDKNVHNSKLARRRHPYLLHYHLSQSGEIYPTT